MKKILSVLKFLFLLFIGFILTMISYLLLSYIQRIVLVPDDFLLWTFNFPMIILIVIVELSLFTGLFYLLHKPFRKSVQASLSNIDFVRKHRKLLFSSFVAVTILFFYSVIVEVTVITPDKITDHSFLRPQGRVYTYEDVLKIDTEVKNKRSQIPLYSQGDFVYSIELIKDKKVYLNDVGETNDYEHPYFIIEEIDRDLVRIGVPKTSSMEHFELATEHLDQLYTDRIKSILENTTVKD